MSSRTASRKGTSSPPDLASETPPTRAGWTVGRVLTALAGCVLALLGLGTLGFGAAAATAAMDNSTYTDLGESADFRSDGYAVSSDPWTPDYMLPGVDSIRMSVTPAGDQAVFAGFAKTPDAEAYLAGVRHTALHAGYTKQEEVDGSAPARTPGQAGIWVSQVEGTGMQALRLDRADLDRAEKDGLMPIVMNADGSARVDAHVAISYRIPRLGAIATGLVLGGLAVTVVGGWLVVRPIRRARRQP